MMKFAVAVYGLVGSGDPDNVDVAEMHGITPCDTLEEISHAIATAREDGSEWCVFEFTNRKYVRRYVRFFPGGYSVKSIE